MNSGAPHSPSQMEKSIITTDKEMEIHPTPPPHSCPCWCIRGCCVCLFGPCCGIHLDFETRVFNCFIDCALFWMGAYAPSSRPFRRDRVKWLENLGSVPPGVDKEKTSISFDVDLTPTRRSLDAATVPVRVYIPCQQPPSLRLPVLILIHGGGFCLGHHAADAYDFLSRKFVNDGFAVVSCSYRLAPENPCPAAVHDCFEVLKWASDPTKSFTFLPPSRVDHNRLVIFGDSAGGNLAMVLATLARDQIDSDLQSTPFKINVAHLLLFYPPMHLFDHDKKWILLDLIRSQTGKYDVLAPNVVRFFGLAYAGLHNNKSLDQQKANKFAQLCLTERRFAPLLAGANGLPPISWFSAGWDTIKTESQIAVQMLCKAGVPCVHRVFESQAHNYVLSLTTPAASLALKLALDDMKHVLRGDDTLLSTWAPLSTRLDLELLGEKVCEEGSLKVNVVVKEDTLALVEV